MGSHFSSNMKTKLTFKRREMRGGYRSVIECVLISMHKSWVQPAVPPLKIK